MILCVARLLLGIAGLIVTFMADGVEDNPPFPTTVHCALLYLTLGFAAVKKHLKLGDERIGLIKDHAKLIYCLYMQRESNGRPSHSLNSKTLHMADVNPDVPGWVIPKPPPRKK